MILKFRNFINEKKYSYNNCVMLFFNFPEIKNLHSHIDKDDIYIDSSDSSYGLEKESHCSLLYGLRNDITTDQVKEILDKFDFNKEYTIKGVSLFENDYDVLKFNINEKILKECNKELRKLPNKNEFPDYKPHITIAYIKKGKGQKYIDLFKKEKYKIKPNHIIYDYNDKNYKIEI